MKTLRLALAGAVAAVIALVVTLGPAFSYPMSDLVVSGGTVVGGTPIEVTAQAAPAGDHPGDKCIELSITYQGETVTGANTLTLSHTFDTRVVDEITSDPVTARCTYNVEIDNQASALGGGSTGKLGTSLIKATVESIGAENTITLLPKSGEKPDDGGLLPNTGGERLAWLVIGGLLVLVGGGVVVASRRRSA